MVILVFLAGLVLYAPGLLWGLPHATAPDRIFPWGSDELAPLGPLAQVYHVVFHGGAAFDPRYPLLPYVIQALFIAPCIAWLRLTGQLRGLEVAYPYGLEDPVSALATMTLFARVSSLLMMAAVPVVAWYTARKLWDARTAFFSASCVLLIYPFFYYARTSNVDAGGVFWASLGLLVFASALRDGLTRRRAAWLGVFAALAIATKDQSYAVFLTLGLAIVALHLRARWPSGWRSTFQAPLVGLATSFAVYAVASGFIFNPAAFQKHIEFVLFHPGGTSGQSYFSTPATLTGYLQLAGSFLSLLIDCLGLPMTLASLAGLLIAGRKSPRTLLIALPVLAILVGIIFPVRFIRIRFLLPAAYVTAIFAGVAFNAIAERTARYLRNREARAQSRIASLAWAPFLLVALWSLVRGADLTWQMLNDSRYQLEAWFRENAAQGDHVGYYGAPLKLPALEPGIISEPAPFADGSGPPQRWPEFIVIIPQQVFETEHEWNITDEHFAQLTSGAWPYEEALSVQAPRLFDKRPIHWVNPHVRVFVRRSAE
jgi:hypothetical protein